LTSSEVQLMDLESYETFSMPLDEDLKGQLTPGAEIQYLDAMGKRRITRA
jgi:translation initiation factor 5A